MSHMRPLVLLLILVSMTGCCKLLNCDHPCPPDPEPIACCEQVANKPGFTGGNLPGMHDTTKISASDIAVLVDRTTVSVSESGQWILSTAIAVDRGNNSTEPGDTHAHILLPADCEVLRVTALNADSTEAAWTQCKAYIDVELAQLDPDDPFMGPAATIEIVLNHSEYTSSDGQPSFAVFAYSGRPDQHPDNNYWWWKNHIDVPHDTDRLNGASSHPSVQPGPSRPLR